MGLVPLFRQDTRELASSLASPMSRHSEKVTSCKLRKEPSERSQTDQHLDLGLPSFHKYIYK